MLIQVDASEFPAYSREVVMKNFWFHCKNIAAVVEDDIATIDSVSYQVKGIQRNGKGMQVHLELKA